MAHRLAPVPLFLRRASGRRWFPCRVGIFVLQRRDYRSSTASHYHLIPKTPLCCTGSMQAAGVISYQAAQSPFGFSPSLVATRAQSASQAIYPVALPYRFSCSRSVNDRARARARSWALTRPSPHFAETPGSRGKQ